jgi:hypothetical protein
MRALCLEKVGLSRLEDLFKGFMANIAQMTFVVPELCACGIILLPVLVNTYL